SPGEGRAYLLLVLDLRQAGNPPACARLADCRPPFLSAAAHARLRAARNDSPGPVGWLELAIAVLGAALDSPRYDKVSVALATVDGHGQGALLSAYQRLGDARDSLQARLVGLVNGAAVAGSAGFAPANAYLEWLRYLRGMPPQSGYGPLLAGSSLQTAANLVRAGRYLAPEEALLACPRQYSLLLSAARAADWSGLPSPLGDQGLNLPQSALVSVEQFFAYLHQPRAVSPPFDGTQALRRSWVMAVAQAPAVAELAAAGGGGAPLLLAAPVELEYRLGQLLADTLAGDGSLVAPAYLLQGAAEEGLGQAFVPLFATRTGPDWPGNLKKLRLRRPGNNEYVAPASLVDVNGVEAWNRGVDGGGGIADGALTFWTRPSQLPVGTGGADGGEDTLGGAGQQIPGMPGSGASIGETNGTGRRTLFLEPPAIVNGSANALLPLDVETTHTGSGTLSAGAAGFNG
ncbi:MAG: hypothetical protein ACK5HY_15170, partial [Parahaliea sp.]